MDQRLEAEVCVIGGGPAGSTVARRLALLGHDVCLIERAAFPRPHIGESLPPGILPLLDVLNLRERIEGAGFLRPERAIVRWAETTDHWKSQPGEPGFQVDRGHFDSILLQAAQEEGVRVIQPAMVVHPTHSSDGWLIPIRCESGTIWMQTRYVVDAAGRHSVLVGRKKRCSSPTIALYAYWRDTDMEGPETRVEAGEEQWFWGAPLPGGTFNATVFVDASRRSSVGVPTIEKLYGSLLSQSSLLSGCLNGKLVSKVTACDASSRLDEQPVDESSIKVGESSFSIDPLSSQGVQAAIQSAIQGSIVVHTILSRPENTPAAMQFYRNRQVETVERHRHFAARHYAEHRRFRDRPFWQRRVVASEDVATQSLFLEQTLHRSYDNLCDNSLLKVSNRVSFVEVPCIVGDVIMPARAVHHPYLERAVAYLSETELVPLLEGMTEPLTATEIVQRWAKYMPLSKCLKILYWMLVKSVLVVAYH